MDKRLYLLTSVKIIRLRGGPNPSEGFVEAQGPQPGWGSVCDSKNGWTLKEAHVICRQLGYTRLDFCQLNLK